MERNITTRDRIETAREILRYFVRHPDAKDTVEGIANWWFGNRQAGRSVEEVTDSLHLLLAKGLVIERQAAALRPYYQVNPTKRTEIASFLDTV